MVPSLSATVMPTTRSRAAPYRWRSGPESAVATTPPIVAVAASPRPSGGGSDSILPGPAEGARAPPPASDRRRGGIATPERRVKRQHLAGAREGRLCPGQRHAGLEHRRQV